MIRFANFERLYKFSFSPETLLTSKSVSLSRSHYLWKSKSDLSLYTRYPHDDDHHEQQPDLSRLEPPELYHARSRYSWTHRHPTIRSGFESTAPLLHPREAPVRPISLAQPVTKPSQPDLPKGSKLLILVTCACVAVFLQALVSIALCYSGLSQNPTPKSGAS